MGRDGRKCQQAGADQRRQASREPRAGQRRALERKSGLRETRRWGEAETPARSEGDARNCSAETAGPGVRERPSPGETGCRKREERQKIPNLDSLLQGPETSNKNRKISLLVLFFKKQATSSKSNILPNQDEGKWAQVEEEASRKAVLF